MKKITLFLFAILFSGLQSYSQSHYFKFRINNKSEINKITRIISIDNVKNNTVWAYANDKEFEEFNKLNYKIEKLPLHNNNNAKVINMATTVADMATWDRYPTYDVYVQMMQDFQTNYPAVCDLDTIGYSQNGRLILVLKISDNVATHEQEPEFFYTSSMHGDEIAGYVLMLRLADYLLSNYGTDAEVTDLVNNFEIYINPNANPDGTYNGGNNDVSGAVRYLADGTDPNRDFPDPRTGANTPYSQETQDMMTFAENHRFVMSANFHGGAEVMNYPWDTWTTADNAHADNVWLQKICKNYVDTARLQNASYMTGITSSGITEGGDWYVIAGGRQDYMTYFNHCKEVTVELSSVKLLSTDLLPAYWNYNKQSLLNYIKEAKYGINGTVKNTNGDPLDAKIEIAGFDKDNSWVVTDPVNGDYYRPVAPGTYDVTYSSYGYISQTISVTVSDWETTTIQNVVLQQASTVTVTGTVTEDGTGNPLENVKIEFLNEAGISPVYTDASGSYTVSGVMENTYDIKASKTGYTPVIQNINISTSNNVVDFTLVVSDAISFETNIPPDFNFSGTADWTRDNSTAYDGTWSMKSGAITDNQTSVMQIELNIAVAGDISFYKKVSSESGYDFLKFYIDGTEKGSWSGIIDWSLESYPVTTGIHTFQWEYSKDGSVSENSDCAWVDFIDFPNLDSSGTDNIGISKIIVYPNPSDGNFTIKSGNNIQKVTVNDITGRLIKIHNSDSKSISDIKLKQGFYILSIYSGNNIIKKKITIE